MTEDRLSRLRSAGVVAVLRAPTVDDALRSVDALVEGGITGIEITCSTPKPARVIREILRRHGDGIYAGAGTIVQADQAKAVADAGARFLVSPGSVPAVAEAMRNTGAVVLLGALTPTEVMLATSMGADAVKVFPASLGGHSYLRALRGPFPTARFMPTGGVNARNIEDWFAAGAVAVGAGGDLAPAAAMAAGNWAAITATARTFAAALERTRAGN